MSIQTNNAPPADKGRLRKTIRKQVAIILKDKTDAGKRVFPNASIPVWNSELPVILVFSRSETASKYAQAPRELERDLDLVIEIIAKGPEENTDAETPATGEKTVEDIVDDIAEQIECEMDIDETLGQLADDSILTNTELEFDSDGGQPIGSARLTYAITYYTMSPRNDAKRKLKGDYKTSNHKFNIGDDPNTVEGEDTVAIPII